MPLSTLRMTGNCACAFALPALVCGAQHVSCYCITVHVRSTSVASIASRCADAACVVQAVRPGGVKLGLHKGEAYYAREDVQELHTRERWQREGRQVRLPLVVAAAGQSVHTPVAGCRDPWSAGLHATGRC